MSSQIRYQFMHSREVRVVKFEGVSLPLDSLKREIISQNSLQASGMDLVVSDTGGSVYPPNSYIQKNTSIIVKQRPPEERTVYVGAGGGGAIPGLSGPGGGPMMMMGGGGAGGSGGGSGASGSGIPGLSGPSTMYVLQPPLPTLGALCA